MLVYRTIHSLLKVLSQFYKINFLKLSFGLMKVQTQIAGIRGQLSIIHNKTKLSLGVFCGQHYTFQLHLQHYQLPSR